MLTKALLFKPKRRLTSIVTTAGLSPKKNGICLIALAYPGPHDGIGK